MTSPDPPEPDRAFPRWPLWRIVLAYALLSVIAITAIWFVDRRAHVDTAPPNAQLPQRS